MLHRSRATLGPILRGLLAAGLGTLVAAAQQPSTAPAPTGATVTRHASNAKDAVTGVTPADQTHNASSDENNTGVSNPDAVTPANESQSSTQPAADATPAPTYVDNSNLLPAADAGDGS